MWCPRNGNATIQVFRTPFNKAQYNPAPNNPRQWSLKIVFKGIWDVDPIAVSPSEPSTSALLRLKYMLWDATKSKAVKDSEAWQRLAANNAKITKSQTL